MVPRLNLIFLLSAVLSQVCLASRVDDAVHYVMKFRSTSDDELEDSAKDILNVLPEKVDPNDLVTISTPNHESYVCHLPNIREEDNRARIASYRGPSPPELLAPIFKSKVCSFRLEPYWSYELCHGRYVLQYHEEKDMKNTIRTEYYLGNYRVDYVSLGAKFDQLNPPTKKVDDDRTLPYYPITYTQGTTCDITGKPRTATVLYMCDPEGSEQIHSLAEVSSCNYEFILFTNKLCSHPAFQPPRKKEFEIVCYDKNGRRDPNPVSLVTLNQQHSDTFKREYSGTVRNGDNSRTKAAPAEQEHLALRLNQDFEAMERRRVEALAAGPPSVGGKVVKSSMGGGGGSTVDDSSEARHVDQQIAVDTVNRILSGKECIQGGGGWWKYEFCYGKRVLQYHVDAGTGQRTEVLLGEFDKEVHKAWIENSERKKIVKMDGKIRQVSNIYVKGDMCAESRAHRSVEVKLRCAMVDGSKLAIALSLQEPETCKYVLVVESDRFCSVLQKADKYGLLDTLSFNTKQEDYFGN